MNGMREKQVERGWARKNRPVDFQFSIVVHPDVEHTRWWRSAANDYCSWTAQKGAPHQLTDNPLSQMPVIRHQCDEETDKVVKADLRRFSPRLPLRNSHWRFPGPGVLVFSQYACMPSKGTLTDGYRTEPKASALSVASRMSPAPAATETSSKGPFGSQQQQSVGSGQSLDRSSHSPGSLPPELAGFSYAASPLSVKLDWNGLVFSD